MAEFPGGGLGGGPDKSKQPETLRQSKVLSSNISLYYMLVIHTWIVHHKIMTCCCMLLLIPVLIVTVKVIQQRG